MKSIVRVFLQQVQNFHQTIFVIISAAAAAAFIAHTHTEASSYALYIIRVNEIIQHPELPLASCLFFQSPPLYEGIFTANVASGALKSRECVRIMQQCAFVYWRCGEQRDVCSLYIYDDVALEMLMEMNWVRLMEAWSNVTSCWFVDFSYYGV